MRIWKRVLALLLVLSLTGCGQQPEPETEPTEKSEIVLDLVTCYGADDGNRKQFEEAIRAYEEKTGIQVWDRSSVSNEEWKNKVLTDFMTGSEPDVLFYFMNADADPFVNAGRVVSIEEIREIYPDYGTNIKETQLIRARDGKHYAVPSFGYWESLLVNRAVLDQCGIEVPGPDYTWDRFLADCEVIRSKGFTPIAASLGEIPHYWFEFLVMNNGSVANHLERPVLEADGSLRMDDTAQKWIAGLEDMKLLYDKNFFPRNTLTAADVETVAMFAEGKAAFLLEGSWKLGYLSEYYPDRLEEYAVSFCPGKGSRRASEVVGGISMGYFITRKAWDNPERRQAAVKLVFHMTSEEVLQSFAAAGAMSLLGESKFPEQNPLQASAAEAYSQVTNMSTALQDSMSGDAKRALFDSIPGVVTGRITPEAAVAAAVKLN